MLEAMMSLLHVWSDRARRSLVSSVLPCVVRLEHRLLLSLQFKHAKTILQRPKGSREPTKQVPLDKIP
jgi:hypothetical protein